MYGILILSGLIIRHLMYYIYFKMGSKKVELYLSQLDIRILQNENLNYTCLS